jgi:hypothetical protein
MPIFTRRRLQAMVNDLQSHLTPGKCNDLLQHLENKRADQALPAEIELALLWALVQVGPTEVEPEWFSYARLPDGYSEALFPGKPAVIEIAALSDAKLAHEDEMRRTAQLICDAANRSRRGSGAHLRFQFLEDGGLPRMTRIECPRY